MSCVLLICVLFIYLFSILALLFKYIGNMSRYHNAACHKLISRFACAAKKKKVSFLCHQKSPDPLQDVGLCVNTIEHVVHVHPFAAVDCLKTQ